MKRVLMMATLVFGLCVLAGAWTGISTPQAGLSSAGGMFVIAQHTWRMVLAFFSGIPELGGLLLLGAGLVLAAWALQRKSNRRRA